MRCESQGKWSDLYWGQQFTSEKALVGTANRVPKTLHNLVRSQRRARLARMELADSFGVGPLDVDSLNV